MILGTLSLSLATFMNVLDTSIANVSLSAIGGDLGVSTTQVTWVITSFGVANAITVPLTGWLSQRFGAVRLFTASIALFSIASLMCGLATSLQELIAFRVIQGAVAGPMIPLSQALLLSSYPKAKAGMALAIWSMTTLVAPVMGPLLGGWITDNISWPWIFYINIPVGAFAAVVTWGIYRRRETARRKLPIDGVGLGLLVLWVGALQIMLDKGQELDWFHSSTIVALAVVAVVVFSVFVVWELVENPYPVVDLRLFKRRNFWTGTLALSLGYGVFFGNVVLLPLWLQQYMGYTATEAGMLTAPVGILALLLSPFVGRSVEQDGSALAGEHGIRDIRGRPVHAHELQHAGEFRLLGRAHHRAGSGPGLLLRAAGEPGAFRPHVPTGYRPPPACRTSRASSAAASARRSQPPCGTTAPSCITRSSPNTFATRATRPGAMYRLCRPEACHRSRRAQRSIAASMLSRIYWRPTMCSGFPPFCSC